MGKTTIATGLMAALRRRGVAVCGAKVGPDFIDPGYHELATGRPGRNLDVFCSGEDGVVALGARASSGGDLLVVEGVMGLFDGVGATSEASTAHVARLLEAPVLLVVDAASMSASVRALVRGYDETLRATTGQGVAGVVLNRVGSDTHESLLREALAEGGPGSSPAVVGVVRRDEQFTWRDRHLGLVPVHEGRAAAAAALERLGGTIARALDLDEVVRIARAAPRRHAPALPAARRVATGVPIAVASGPAFSFAYRDNLERLEEAGAVLVHFDPIDAPALPAGTRALYAGGGFPEVFSDALSSNVPLLTDVRRALAAGLPTWAECGGMLWLSRSVDGTPMCGAIPTAATMRGRITVGYRRAEVRRDNPVSPAGSALRGHELHYSEVSPGGDALELTGRSGTRLEGFASPSVLATYLHLHLGTEPGPAERFVAAAAASGATSGEASASPV